MNPIAPVSMLTGKGSGAAIMVVAALVGLALFAQQQQSTIPKTKN
jgi:hypothetical protein